MKKIKIIYIVSNLRRTGPVNQLLYILRGLDRNKVEPIVITLSAEPSESRIQDYIHYGIKVESLNLSRFKGVFLANKYVARCIDKYCPDIIQTQGIRADAIISNLDSNIPWVTTSRNFPIEDYPSKFGWLKGTIMAKKHLKYLSRCTNLVSCSKAIELKLKSVNIPSFVISNGVEVDLGLLSESGFAVQNKLTFITVGSLIERKNMFFLIDMFNKCDGAMPDYEFLILGDGPLRGDLELKSNKKMKFLGDVNNVKEYLLNSDIFFSSSLSEGLPNTVLEAISCGVPVVLSDISPHKEIASQLSNRFYHIFSLEEGNEKLANELITIVDKFSLVDKQQLISETQSAFSALEMSGKYQMLYEGITNV
ncbi:glycosyltransferase [Psychromonas sp.]|nr:glycosyltransferase [Psychromonas sp.]